MNKISSLIGKKNIIIISGILLIGIAIYLNLTLQFENPDDGYVMENSYYGESDEDYKVLGQAALVDNLNVGEDMGDGAGTDGADLENEDLKSENLAEDNYFAVSVVSRQRARDESVDLLNSIVDNAESMPDVRDHALQEIAVIAQEIEKEANIETLVKAKGFAECVAVVSGENANVIVKTDGLMPNEVGQIKEIVYEQTGIIPGNVKIVEKN
jgi:stage III sporulation protein AH